MKKTILLSSIALLFLNALSFAQFNTLWERCNRTGNKPSWFGNGTERGMAFGNMGNGERLYIVSRNDNSIKVVDPVDGSDINLPTPFDLSGCSGGTFAVNDCDLTDDGVLIVGNLTINASSTSFKLYVWTTEGGSFSNSASFTLSAHRYGDHIKVTGSWSAGTVKVYVPAASMSPNAFVYVFSTSDQGTTWQQTQITLSGAYNNTVGNSHVAVLPDGSFFISGNGMNPRKHNSSGAYVANTLFPGTNSSIAALRYFSHNGREYIISNQYREIGYSGGNKVTRARIYDVTNPGQPGYAAPYGKTPYLADSAAGDIPNSVNGDIEFKYSSDGKIKIYVLGCDQGIAAYETNTAPLPVVLSSISASAIGKNVVLRWTTETEVNNHMFEIERADIEKDPENYVKIGEVKGAGNSNRKIDYEFVDKNLSSGKYAYRLKQIDFDGKTEYFKTNVVEVKIKPVEFSLEQNYPNPFNPSTTIKFALPEKSSVVLKVYDVTGKEIATLANGTFEAGEHKVEFNAANLKSGIYVYKLQAGDKSFSRKMILMK